MAVPASPKPALPWPDQAGILAAIAAGGLVGGLARHVAQQLWPSTLGSVDWAIVVVNILGSALLGVLMGLVETRREGHRMVRPFLGVGVCGGFTTFSASMLGTEQLMATGRLAAAGGHLALTLLGSLVVLTLAVVITERVVALGTQPGGL